jgi:hypothetical protein
MAFDDPLFTLIWKSEIKKELTRQNFVSKTQNPIEAISSIQMRNKLIGSFNKQKIKFILIKFESNKA